MNRAFEELNWFKTDLVFEIHSAYVDAGADVIESNTFGANRMKFGNFGLWNEVAKFNAAGVAFARTAAGAGRTLYLSSADFVVSYARRFAKLGVRLVGGCCGTTPDHTRSIRPAIEAVSCETNDEKL